MLKKLPIWVAFVLLVLTGILHGRITNRWGYSPSLQQAVDRLDRIPLLVGDWDGTVLEVNKDPIATKGMGTYVTARFVNRSRGDVVDLTLVCGRSGPLAMHPPTICFPAHGFKPAGPVVKTSVPLKESEQKVEFASTDFARRAETLADRVHILWSFGLNGTWTIPNDPRTEWAKYPAVYKLYVLSRSPGTTLPDEDPTVRFLRVYLPDLQKVLFGS